MDLREIPGFPNYMVTMDGRIWSKTGKWKKPSVTQDGYLRVWLWNNGKQYPRRVHRLVLETFIGPCPEGMQGCHFDGTRTNNRLSNLRWDTRSGNQFDAVRHGTHYTLGLYGEKHPGSKLSDQQSI